MLRRIRTEEQIKKIFFIFKEDISKNFEIFNIYKNNNNSLRGVFYDVIYVQNFLERVLDVLNIGYPNYSLKKIIPIKTVEMNNLLNYFNGLNKNILAKAMYYYEFQLNRLETNIKDLE